MRWAGAVLAVVLLFLPAAGPAVAESVLLAVKEGALPAARDELIDDGWFLARFLGQPAGYIHSVIKKTRLEGRDVVYEHSKIVRRTVVRGVEQHGEETSQSWCTLEGEVIRETSSETDGPQREELTLERDGNVLKMVHRLNDAESRKTIEIPEGTKVSVGMEGWLLVRLGMGVGKTYALTVFSDQSKKLETETTVVEGRRSVMLEGKQQDVFVIKSTMSDMPGMTAELLVTPEGKMLSVKMLTFQFVRTTKEDALAAGEAAGPKLESLVKLTGGIPVFEALESMTVTVEVTGDTDGKIIKSNEYQKVKATIGRYEVEMVPRPAPEKGKETLPITVTDKELERYAGPATFIQSDHKDIKAAAEKALDGENEPVAAARKLCEWVFRTLKKESPKTGMASALETLESGTGDCSEHAALYCALARAAGLPSREAFGIAIVWPAAGYHAWSEVLIDGKWVVVDASNNVFGVPPAYLLLGHSDGSHSDVSDSTSSFARLFANCDATVTAGVRRGKTFDPRDPATFHRIEGTTYYNGLFDVSVDVSGGWKALMHGPQAIQLTAPSTMVMVVSAVFGSIPSEDEWKELGEGFRAASGATEFNRLDDAKLAGLDGRAYSFKITRGEASMDGRLRVASSGSNVYTVVVMGASIFKFTEDALTAPFSRLKLGPPKKPSTDK